MSAVPGLTDSAEYSELWFRVRDSVDILGAASWNSHLPEVASRISAHELATARRYQAAADALVLRYVQDMRAAGLPWRKIGAALGVSLQAAQQLYARGKNAK